MTNARVHAAIRLPPVALTDTLPHVVPLCVFDACSAIVDCWTVAVFAGDITVIIVEGVACIVSVSKPHILAHAYAVASIRVVLTFVTLFWFWSVAQLTRVCAWVVELTAILKSIPTFHALTDSTICLTLLLRVLNAPHTVCFAWPITASCAGRVTWTRPQKAFCTTPELIANASAGVLITMGIIDAIRAVYISGAGATFAAR